MVVYVCVVLSGDGGGSSKSMRMGGETSSSYWPFLMLHMKAPKNRAATEILAISKRIITLMQQNYFAAAHSLMRVISIIYDFNHAFNRSHLAARLLQPKVMSRMLRLLAGMRMAATRGDKRPLTAKNIPMML